jgi:hypothetical protein
MHQVTKHIPRRYVSDTLNALATFDVANLDVVSFDLTNDGEAALNAFEIRVRSGDSVSHRHVRRDPGSTSIKDDFIIDTSGAAEVLAPGDTVQLSINVAYKESLEIWASTAETEETVLDIVMSGFKNSR